MIHRGTWRGIAFLALLAALTWLLARQSAPPAEAPPETVDTRLNYALHEFYGRLLNKEGGLGLEVKSPLLRNNAESGIGTVQAPEFHLRAGEDRWRISAESAIISADREHVTLMGDVLLSKRNEFTDQLLDIATADVLLNVTPRTAFTDAPVSIRQRHERLDATGMKLDMINESYELLHEVRATYEPR